MVIQSLSRAPVGVIDIGSNSVRLVAYDRLSRSPTPMFNEKSLCGLGREVAVTGLLPADGLVQAREAIRRYKVLCALMKVERLFVLATAAARRASNGPAFIEETEAILGQKVSMLPGVEEARLAALGVVAGLHRPCGLVGDLGGGSLELIDIDGGALGEGVSLELGGLALRDSSGRDLKKAAGIVSRAFRQYPRIGKAGGGHLFAIGGTWRAIARLHMAQTHYPLNVLHQYAVPAAAIIAFCRQLKKADVETLPAIQEIAKERRPLLVYGALVLEMLLEHAQIERFVISTSGVREGVLYSQLPAAMRMQDPLVVGARALSDLHARDPAHADELIAWTDGFAASLPRGESEAQRRLRHAACLVSEVAWRTNPDYRAEEAARVVAYAALNAITHEERAFLASVQYARYEGPNENAVPPLRMLLSPARVEEARALGCLIRIAYNISAGQPGVLARTPILMEEGVLKLRLPQRFADLSNERLAGRLRQTAKTLGCAYAVEVEQ